MEKIEFYPNEFLVIEEKLIPEKNIPQLSQCLEKQSWLSKFKNLFKKKKITNWFDLEVELGKFLYECSAVKYPNYIILSNETFKLNVKNTKKFIKKFNKYHYYNNKKGRFSGIKIESTGLISFVFFGNFIYINVIE